MPTSNVVGSRIIVLATLFLPQHFPPEYWVRLSQELAKAADLTPRRSDVERYEPQGMTVTTYLSESHITVETYPEKNLVEIELMSCKDFDPILLGAPLAIDCLGPVEGAKLVGWTILRKNKDHEWRRC